MIQATLPVAFEIVEALDNYLLEHGDARWMVTQDLPSRSASLTGIFDSEDEARDAWTALNVPASPLSGSPAPELRDLADQDWRDSYKLHFKAWQFGRLHWVPVWEQSSYRLPEGHVVIWLDPGLAFGTGNHETTRLCCERLVTLADEFPLAGAVADAGCGSGILALSAAKLGFTDVYGFDNDPESVRVSEENAALNHLTGRVRFKVADLTYGWDAKQYSIVLANIQADVLMRFALQLLAATAPSGALVLSGILAREIEQVREHFKSCAPEWAQSSRILGEWADLVLRRPT